MIIFILKHIHHGEGGRAALRVAEEDDLVTFRLTADVLQIRYHREPHVYDAPRGAFRVHVGVDAVGRHAVADVVGDGDGVALVGEYALEREGLGGALEVGSDGIVAHEDEVLHRS